MAKKIATNAKCEKCRYGCGCRILNPYKCDNFVVEVNTSFNAVVEPELVSPQLITSLP